MLSKAEYKFFFAVDISALSLLTLSFLYSSPLSFFLVKNMEISNDVLHEFFEKYRTFVRYSLMEACRVLGLESQKNSKLKEALKHFETYLYVARQVGGKFEAEAHGMLGTCYMNLGQYDKAMHHLQVLIDVAKQLGRKYDEMQAYLHLANCYSYLGQHDKAIQYCYWCINFAKQTENKPCEGYAHLTIGNCYCSLEKQEETLHHYQASFNIAKQIGDKELEGRTHCGLGHYYSKLEEEHDKALNHYQTSTDIAKEVGDKTDEAIASYHLGSCFFHLEQYDKAITHLEVASKIAEQSGDNLTVAKANAFLGDCYFFGFDQYDKAEQHFKQALQYDRKLFNSIPRQDQFKVSTREHFIRSYRTLTLVLMIQDKAQEALLVAESGRSRALAELMFTSYSLKSTDESKAKALSLSEIREVVRSLDTTVIYFSLLEKTNASTIWSWIIQPNGQIQHMPCGIVSEETSTCTSDAIKEAPLAVKWTNIIPLIDQTRQMLKGHCSEDCEDRSLSFLYPEDHVKHTSNRLIEDEEEEAEAQNYLDKRNEACKNLYQILCSCLQELTEGSHVVIVADGPLHLIPFAALIDENGRYLSESLQLRHVPSLVVANLMMEHRLEREGLTSPLIVGDPAAPLRKCRLPCANEEARMIGKLLNVEPLIGEHATKVQVLQNLEKASLIHIAAHGDMKRGEILLAPNPGSKGKKEDYMLMLSDLEGRSLKAKLVVLSCCHSAEGEVKADGVIGIARAFLGAGACSVLVALWAISDEGTLFLMKTFYEHLSRGLKANESLSKTMESMRKTTKFCDPHYWAPFVLIGDDVTLF